MTTLPKPHPLLLPPPANLLPLGIRADFLHHDTRFKLARYSTLLLDCARTKFSMHHTAAATYFRPLSRAQAKAVYSAFITQPPSPHRREKGENSKKKGRGRADGDSEEDTLGRQLQRPRMWMCVCQSCYCRKLARERERDPREAPELGKPAAAAILQCGKEVPGQNRGAG